MRIVAGELGGRRLWAPAAGRLRPTGDRVREAVFSILGEAVEGEEVLDVFCGTGAMGIEALSRGARRATLVDSDVAAAIRNVADLHLGGRCDVVRSDAARYLRREEARFGLIFCDPPYKLARPLGPDLDTLLGPRVREGGRVITESAAGEPLDLSLPLLDERRYGGTVIRIHGSAA